MTFFRSLKRKKKTTEPTHRSDVTCCLGLKHRLGQDFKPHLLSKVHTLASEYYTDFKSFCQGGLAS